MINRVGLWVIGVLLWLPSWAWAAAGTVQVVMGPARIIQSTGQERAAIKGDQIFVGDIITTGAAGQVQIRMIDDARLWVRPNSRLAIDQYPTDAAAAKQAQAQTATRLVEGSLRAVTGAIGKASPDKVSLSTPNAVIGIRGTDFELAYFPDRLAASMQTAPGTYHRVYDGRTRLTAPGMAPLDVLSGQAVFVSLKPGEGPRVLPQVPPFLNLPDGPVAAASAREATPAARPLKIGLRMASPMADGAVVTSSAGAPVEPNQTSAAAREGEPARLSLSYAPPPSSRQRRAPEPPTTVTLDITAKLQDGQAQVLVQDPARGGSLNLTMPLGTWTDISGRASWLAGGRQTISSSSARPESAQVLVRVDAAP